MPALPDVSDLETRIGEAVERSMQRTGVPGVALGLLHEGREWSAGFGITHAEHPLAVDAETLFQIASLTKPFTATVLLRLVEQGRLGLEDPVADLLPGLRLAVPEWSRRLRVEHLLTHVGGFEGDRFFVRAPEPPTLEALVEALPEARCLAEPGALWSYNNAGFSVAGRLLEVLTAQPYPEALRELVLAPLGLDKSLFSADEAVFHRVALPHLATPRGPVMIRGAGWQPGWELLPSDLPAGGLASCVTDLLRWARFHLGDGRAADGTRLLEAETLARMRHQTHPAGGNDDAVGLAWLLNDLGGERFFGHEGQTAGYRSSLLLHHGRGFALVVLTNEVNGHQLVREVERFVLREALGLEVRDPQPRPQATGRAEDFFGRYDHPFAELEVRAGEAPGELVVEGHARPFDATCWQPPPPGPTRVGFYAPDRVVALAPEVAQGARAEFGRDARGRVAWLRSGGRVAPRL